MFKHICFLSFGAFVLFAIPVHGQGKKADVAELIDRLQKGTNAVKVSAAVALAELGRDAEPAVPALVAMLQAKGEDLRLNAAIALGRIGAPAVAPVAKVLASDNASDRYYAIWTLGWIGPAAKETAPRVIEALADKDESVRRKAAYTLGRIAPEAKTVIAPLLKLFADGNTDVRQAAAETLALFGAQAVPALIDALKDHRISVRAEAARALGKIGIEAKDAVPHLKPLFFTTEGKEWSQAADALAKIGKASLPVLAEAIKSDNTVIRARAAQTLGKLGADGVPMLVDALADKHLDVRKSAVAALAPLRVGDKLVVLALAHAAADGDPPFRNQCLQALRQLGVGAKPAAPKLAEVLKTVDGPGKIQILQVLQGMGETDALVGVAAELLKDGSAQVRQSAVNLLASQGSKAIPHLIAALSDQENSVRFAAVFALQRTPGDIKEAMPALLAMLKIGTTFQRRSVMQTLARVGEPAVPHLVVGLKDPENLIRSQAAFYLGGIGADAKKALPALSDMILKDTYATARTNAVIAIAKIDVDKLSGVYTSVKKHPDEKIRSSAYGALFTRFGKKGAALGAIPAKLALPFLIDAAMDKSVNIRLIGVQGLGGLGADGKDAIPTVTALLNDADARVRAQAAISLKRIQGK